MLEDQYKNCAEGYLDAERKSLDLRKYQSNKLYKFGYDVGVFVDFHCTPEDLKQL